MPRRTYHTPEEAMREVTKDIILRAIKMAKRKGRTISSSKAARGRGVDVATLDPRTPEGSRRLEALLTPVRRQYTWYGLGPPEESNAISWRSLNLPLWRRGLVGFLVTVSLFMKGTPLKNILYRWMGAHIGKNVEIMQMVWLDHYRRELIWIGDNTLIGAFTRITAHGYEGAGRFRYGLVEIGKDCRIGAGTGMGPIKIEDGVRTLPGTTLSPYLARVRAGSVVGYNPPPPPPSVSPRPPIPLSRKPACRTRNNSMMRTAMNSTGRVSQNSRRCRVRLAERSSGEQEITQDRLQLDCVEVVWYEVGRSVQAHAQPGPEGGVP